MKLLKILSIYIFIILLYLLGSHFLFHLIDTDGLRVLIAVEIGIFILFYVEYIVTKRGIQSVDSAKNILKIALIYFIGLTVYRIFFKEPLDTGSDHYGYAGMEDAFEVAMQTGFGVVILLYAGFRYIMLKKSKEVFKLIDKILSFSKYIIVSDIVLLIIIIFSYRYFNFTG